MHLIKKICSLALLTASFSVVAQSIETIEYKNYTISPRSPYEIKPELMRNTPIRSRGESFNGHTDWYIDWSYQSTSDRYGCHLHSIQTRVHVVYILPVLSPHVTDARTIEVFNKFSEVLSRHETNHGNHGLLAAREVDNALNNIPPQQNCRNIKRLADGVVQQIIQKYIQKDDDYDRTTRNGETEGAVIY